jgi:curved DNA-binding protein
MTNDDYYRTLNVSSDASPEIIKKAYRKLALETHPDRNPGDGGAEERFKQINEAYAVLSDPQRRAQYDQYRAGGFRPRPGSPFGGGGFGASQEDLFREFFTAGQHRDVFSEMQREFARMGVRFDENFINRLFFGGKGVFFQGVFFGGPGGVRIVRYGKPDAAGPDAAREVGERPASRGLLHSALSWAGRKVGKLLLKALGDSLSASPLPTGRIAEKAGEPELVYSLEITPAQALEGVIVEVEFPHIEKGNRYSVRIPPGVKSGTRLRLKDMGRAQPGGLEERKDLYIELRVA